VSEHMPGPWRWTPCDDPDAGERLVDARGGEVASGGAVGDDSGGGWIEGGIDVSTPFDARLIAAAPELLKTLRAYTDHPDVLGVPELDEIARALIRRIEGES